VKFGAVLALLDKRISNLLFPTSPSVASCYRNWDNPGLMGYLACMQTYFYLNLHNAEQSFKNDIAFTNWVLLFFI